MTDLNTPEITPSEASAQRDTLLRDSSFVGRWNQGDPAAIAQIGRLDTILVNGGSGSDKPRPPAAGGETTLLTQDQSRALAQASLDAGADVASVMVAMSDDPDFKPDTRTKSERAWDEDHSVGHPERYNPNAGAHFRDDDPAEREALSDVVRTFVAHVGLDRSGGSELAETMVKTMAEQRGQRPETRALYQQQQLARLGDKADALVADAAKSLQGVNRDVLKLLHQSGALDSADVIASLAFAHQARAARG